jgi:hypothetical protein
MLISKLVLKIGKKCDGIRFARGVFLRGRHA